MTAKTPNKPIYLDYAATTPVLPEVADAVREAMLAFGGNASSQHAAGRAARRAVDDACERMTELLGGGPGDRLLITSGGTESNNHALRGAMPAGGGARLVTSAIEHPSVAAIADRLESEGHTVDRLPADATGVVRVDGLADRLTPETRVVSLMLGNSETGVVQPVERVVQVVRESNIAVHAAVHTDATQAVGRRPVHFGELGVAMLTFAAHKFHGPKGVGGLLVRRDCRPAPLLAGQAEGERPGTPPVALVLGMLKALQIATSGLEERVARLSGLRDRFERAICGEIPEAVVIGAEVPRLPHTSNLAFVGQDRQALLMALDRAGVACSTGSACASGSSEPSPVLVAMGLPEVQIRGALRFSFGVTTTDAEVDEAVCRILSVCKQLGG